jgi:hypothetical protein
LVSNCLPRHRANEFNQIPQPLGKEAPAGQEVDLVMNNYSTHKSALVQRWLKPTKRRRFDFNLTPTSGSWLNQVEHLFGFITDRMIGRGTFLCVGDIEQAIYQCLARWNQKPQPFVWKATADVILDKVRRCREAIVKT